MPHSCHHPAIKPLDSTALSFFLLLSFHPFPTRVNIKGKYKAQCTWCYHVFFSHFALYLLDQNMSYIIIKRTLSPLTAWFVTRNIQTSATCPPYTCNRKAPAQTSPLCSRTLHSYSMDMQYTHTPWKVKWSTITSKVLCWKTTECNAIKHKDQSQLSTP